tara:strand:- start:2692 stop:2853 length:162 start_codon:yes stop_codon:yes gene_type:complete
MTQQLEKEVFIFLEQLRDSGVTNMFGASPYIQEEFSLDKKTAKDLLIQWIKNK